MKTRFASAAAFCVAAANALKYKEDGVFYRDGDKWRNQYGEELYWSHAGS